MIPELELLARLRDLHPPPATGWWPPAPGWWLLLALATLLAAIAVRHAPGWWRRLRLRRRLLAALEATASAAEVSQLLRVAVLARFPGRGAEALHGAAWIDFLESRDRAPGRFAGLRDALTVHPYRPARPGEDLARLRAAVRGWLQVVL